jgi:hypothetical protein
VTKLHQILALEGTAKNRAKTVLDVAYHGLQKPALLNGFSRVYTPLDDDATTSDQLPAEGTRVQLRAPKAIADVSTALTRVFDLVLTREFANTEATADLVVDGTTIAEGVPVAYLLFLEKQLTDLRTFFTKLPVLDPAEDWEWSDETATYKSQPVQTRRSQKVPRNHVKYDATPEHPAQVEMYMEDVPVGTWTAVKFSGALRQTEVDDYVERISKVLDAVKSARAEANTLDVANQSIGTSLFEFVLGSNGSE